MLLPAICVQFLAGLGADRYDRELALRAARRDLEVAGAQTAQLLERHVERVDAELLGVLTQQALAQYVGFAFHEFDREAGRERSTLQASLERLAHADPDMLRLELYDHRGVRIAAFADGEREAQEVAADPRWAADLSRQGRSLVHEDNGRLRLSRRVAIDGDAGWSVIASAVFEIGPPARRAFAFAARNLPRAAGRLAWEPGPHGAPFALRLAGEPPADEDLRHARAVPYLGGTLEISLPLAAALVLHREHQFAQAATQGLVTVVLVGLIWLGLRWAVMAPVERIAGQLSAFEAGRSPPPPPSGADVLARLGGALDKAMRGWLSSTNELRQLAATLEDRVAERSAQLAASEERYQLAIRGANDAIVDWNLESGWMFLSPRFAEILGLSVSPLPEPAAWLERVHPDDRRSLDETLAAHFAAPEQPFAHEHRLAHADGSWRWVLARGQCVCGPDGRAVRLVGSLSDVTERRLAHDELHRRAIHDPLTGLYNRQHLIDRLERAIRSSQRYQHPLSLCMCDLDHFKGINDHHGHRLGDEALAEFGRLIRAELRDSDFAGRYGGDEFCIVFPFTTAEQARVSTERIRVALSRLDLRGAGQVHVPLSATFGIAELNEQPSNAAELMERADRGLYQAKRAGRNQSAIAG